MFKSLKRVFVSLVVKFLPETRFFFIKRRLYEMIGHKIGRNVRICSSVKIIGIGVLELGDNTWVGLQTMIISSSLVKIGRNVDIAPQVFIGTGTHEINTDGTRMAGKGINRNVTIGDGTWIGARAVILPGVTIGEMCIIAAGAVVNKDVASYTLVAGVPAKFIKSLKDN